MALYLTKEWISRHTSNLIYCTDVCRYGNLKIVIQVKSRVWITTAQADSRRTYQVELSLRDAAAYPWTGGSCFWCLTCQWEGEGQRYDVTLKLLSNEMRGLASVLKPLAHATTMLSAEKNPSISVIKPILTALLEKNTCAHLMTIVLE